MDYLIHFEDGSYGYLAHHGVKGMKWGKWNEETKNRYSSINRGSSIGLKAAKEGKTFDDVLKDKRLASDETAREAALDIYTMTKGDFGGNTPLEAQLERDVSRVKIGKSRALRKGRQALEKMFHDRGEQIIDNHYYYETQNFPYKARPDVDIRDRY